MKLMLAFAIMVAINVLLFLSQVSVSALAVETDVVSPVFYEGNAFLEEYNVAETEGNYTINSDLNRVLPTSSPSVVQDVQAFLFPLQVFLNWLLGIPSFIFALLMAVPNFLGMLGLPQAVAWALGVLWHSITAMLIVLTVVK
jgi:hypothetical protein